MVTFENAGRLNGSYIIDAFFEWCYSDPENEYRIVVIHGDPLIVVLYDRIGKAARFTIKQEGKAAYAESIDNGHSFALEAATATVNLDFNSKLSSPWQPFREEFDENECSACPKWYVQIGFFSRVHERTEAFLIRDGVSQKGWFGKKAYFILSMLLEICFLFVFTTIRIGAAMSSQWFKIMLLLAVLS